MTGLSSILQPLSTDSTLQKPPDPTHRDRPKPPTTDSALAVDPHHTSPRTSPPLASTALAATTHETDIPPSTVRHHRYSLAALAREKTNNALANFSLRPKASSQSLHSSSSSSESPTKPDVLATTSAAQRAANSKPVPSDSTRTRVDQTSIEADVSRTVERAGPAPTIQPTSTAKSQSSQVKRTPSPGQEPESAPTTRNLQGALNKMHQTSSRLLRMTDEERPFTRDFEDLFSTLIVSLPLSANGLV